MTLLRTTGLLLGLMTVLPLATSANAADKNDTVKKKNRLPVVFADDFENGADHWQPPDSTSWKIKKTDSVSVYSQFKKHSNYKPPHRSPYNLSLLNDVLVGDFVLTVKVLSTHPDYGHRDVCLFFGYQDPAHFYYVHLGKKADDHANQIFIVNDAPRTKISTKTTSGTGDDESANRSIRAELFNKPDRLGDKSA